MDLNQQIDSIYAALPDAKCQRVCQDSCGPILLTKPELDRIKAKQGGPVPPPREDLSCPLLSIMGHCTVYDVRPAICRLYGLLRSLSCPHGCVPERWMDDTDAHIVLERLRRLTPDQQLYNLQGRPCPQEAPTP